MAKSETERPGVWAHLSPGPLAPGALAGSAAVVIDVLRATTVMVYALAAGCEAVVPCLEIDEARAAASSLPAGTALLAGERQGLPIEGFDFGNSPGSFTPEVCLGKTLVMTTTNGTKALLGALDAGRVYVAAFSNLAATAWALNRFAGPVHLICAGTDGLVSFEDAALAGALAAALDRPFGNDEALIAAGLWASCRARVDRGEPLAAVLAEGRGGRRVQAIGLAPDIKAAAAVDHAPLVAELRRQPLRVVRAAG